jgi:hypothetical protein
MGSHIDNDMAVRIYDADDYSNYIEEGERRYDMMSTRHWEALLGKPSSFAWWTFERGTWLGAYVTMSAAYNARFERCFLYDAELRSCTLRSCHVHFTERFYVDSCLFYNCVLTTTGGGAVLFTGGVSLDNCTLRGNFTEDEGRSDMQTTAKDIVAVQTHPYEVHNNIVLKDCVINCLRRWIWWHRSSPKGKRRSKYVSRPKWRGKAAGKRKMEVQDVFDVSEQFEMPERRCEWSVVHTKEKPLPVKKRKMDLT